VGRTPLACPAQAEGPVPEDDDSDEFAASVERDLAQLPTTNERDRDLS